MIPIKDELPTRSTPVMTIALIAANALVFLWQISLGPAREYGVMRLGLTPIELRGIFSYAHGAVNVLPIVTIFTSMFLHGGIGHLAGNMLYLWIFGNNVEDALGSLRFVGFYLLAGLVAALVQVFTASDPTIAMIGASGAVSGVLGAYLRLHPRARVLTLVPLFFYVSILHVPAYLFLILWFAGNFLSAMATAGTHGGGVAFFAHVGGFVAGMLLVGPFRAWAGRARYA